MAGSNNHNLTPLTNGLYPVAHSQTSASPSPLAELADSLRTALPRPANLLNDGTGTHPAFPEDFWTNEVNRNRNFLDFPPRIPSARADRAFYLGGVVSLGPEEERTAVVRTLDGCDVACSTRGCEGLERLREKILVKICHHFSGEHEGRTFVAHAAEQCTPTDSRVVSRAGSRAPTRPPSPAGS